ncbi:hypothetical protein STENM223S_10383 [Streptomyces tendae]
MLQLAAGMTTAATDLLLTPPAPWWNAVWPLPCYLTSLTIRAWTVLCMCEKTAQRAPDGNHQPDNWERTAQHPYAPRRV